MSNVRKNERSVHRFTVTDKALDLFGHTENLIVGKSFDRVHQSLINKLEDEATMIYHCCRVANEDLDNRNKEEAKKRIELQNEALQHCRWMKTYVMMAKRTFHL